MAKFGWIAGIVLVAGAAIAFAMNEAAGDKVYSWRYKMTVAVETPEGVKTGSAVREVTVRFIHRPLMDPKYQYAPKKTMEGEAVVVDLGERGKLFAVLGDASSLPFRVFDGPPGLTIEGAEFYSQLKAKTKLDKSRYPKIVTFKDVNDPESVQLLYGTKAKKKGEPGPAYVLQDNFEKYYGKGFALKEITVEMTDEPVTWNVHDFLSWLPEYYGITLDRRRIHTIDAENRLANQLSVGSFTTKTGE